MDTNKYTLLEKEMVTYQNLLNITVEENNEPLVEVVSGIIANRNWKILVRKKIYEKILNSQNLLQKINPDYSLLITEGYRDLEIQTKRFLEQLKITSNKFFANPIDLYEETHRFVAVPTVAGHPTGGAIDIVIQNKKTNEFLDFGSIQYDYSTKDCYVFAKNVNYQAKRNRLLLRKVLMTVGFAPFDGEWWHFSYGDREWAYYYSKRNAVYDQLSVDDGFCLGLND